MAVKAAMNDGQVRNIVGVGKVSGKDWKTAKQPARAANKTFKRPTHEDVAKEREFRRLAKEQRAEAAAKRKEIMRVERERRAKVKEAKEKRQKAAEVVQEISTATAKRMMKSKKQRKLVKSG